jgi:hypothetical protein
MNSGALTGIIIGAVVLLIGICYLLGRLFIKPRKTIVRCSIPIEFRPPKLVIKDEPVVVKRPKTKREKRKMRIIQMRNSFKLLSENTNTVYEQDEYKTDETEQNDTQFGFSFPSLLAVISRKLSGKLNGETAASVVVEHEECQDIETGLDLTEEQPTASKKGLFVSQDRLDRAAARKMLVESQKGPSLEIFDECIEQKEEGEHIVSVMDLEKIRTERSKQLVVERKKLRQEMRLEAEAENAEDLVAINSGPHPRFIPRGWRASDVVPTICDAELVKQKVMFLLEKSDSQRVGGWFPGSVAGPSRKPNCNYNIKFDRIETGTLFVDGIRNVELSLVGENAYGRRWIILTEVPLDQPILFYKSSKLSAK